MDNPWLVWAVYLGHRLGEARGWRRGTRLGVRRGLTILLSPHAEGDVVRYSELFPALRALDISCERVADVLAEMGVLLDDRRPSFEDWMKRKLAGLGPPGLTVAFGFVGGFQAWACDGGPLFVRRGLAGPRPAASRASTSTPAHLTRVSGSRGSGRGGIGGVVRPATHTRCCCRCPARTRISVSGVEDHRGDSAPHDGVGDQPSAGCALLLSCAPRRCPGSTSPRTLRRRAARSPGTTTAATTT